MSPRLRSALKRFDFDDVRASHLHQDCGVRAIVDVRMVDDGNTCKRVTRLDCGHVPFGQCQKFRVRIRARAGSRRAM